MRIESSEQKPLEYHPAYMRDNMREIIAQIRRRALEDPEICGIAVQKARQALRSFAKTANPNHRRDIH